MDVDNEEIYKWIDTYQFSRQKRNINRDFSDAVPLAEILKQHFPKLVEIHNYAPKNSVAQKMINWTMLQRKVLAKLKINLTKTTLEELARAEPGAIEKVLSQVKVMIEKSNTKQDKEEDVYYVEGLNTPMNGEIVPIKMRQGSKICQQKIVPSDIFDQMVKGTEEKDEIITSLKSKVEHLEELIKVKDDRIEDLNSQVKCLQIEAERRPKNRFISDIF